MATNFLHALMMLTSAYVEKQLPNLDVDRVAFITQQSFEHITEDTDYVLALDNMPIKAAASLVFGRFCKKFEELQEEQGPASYSWGTKGLGVGELMVRIQNLGDEIGAMNLPQTESVFAELGFDMVKVMEEAMDQTIPTTATETLAHIKSIAVFEGRGDQLRQAFSTVATRFLNQA